MARRWLALALIAFAAVSGFILYLHENRIVVSEARAIALPHHGAGIFMTIRNNWFTGLCMVGARLPDYPGARVELHRTVHEGGIVRMEPVDRICAGPFGEIRLEHGSYHIMVMGAKIVGDAVRVELIFDNGYVAAVDVPVEYSISPPR